MPVNLNTFATRANAVSDSQSLYVNKKGLQDTGKIGTFFTRSETFRKTTQEFLNAFTAEYGDRIGGLATKLLQHDLDAGKPLTAAKVKEFIAYGDKEVQLKRQYEQTCQLRTARASVAINDIIRDRQHAVDFIRVICEDPQREVDYVESQLFQEAVHHCMPVLLRDAHLISGDYIKTLATQINEGQCPFLDKALDLILQPADSKETNLGNDAVADRINSPVYDADLTQEQWDDAWDSEAQKVIRDKLHVFMLIEPSSTKEVDEDMLVRVCSALSKLRENHAWQDVPQDQVFNGLGPMFDDPKTSPDAITRAEIFNAVFPSETTPTMTRPTDAEINQFSAAEMKECLQQAREDFNLHFSAKDLPKDSPFKGTGRNLEAGVLMAKKLMVPPEILATLTGDRVTLKDLPQLQALNRLITPDKSNDELKQDIFQSVCRNGTQGPTSSEIPPKMTVRLADGTETTMDLGPISDADGALSDDQKAYNDGKPSNILSTIYNQAKAATTTPTQTYVLQQLLTNDAKAPLMDMMNTFGDFTGITENCKFDYLVEQQQNGDLQVTISTGKELEAFFGKGSITYSMNHLNRLSIEDFQWEAPSLEIRKQAMLEDKNAPDSAPELLSKSIRDTQMGKDAGEIYAELAKPILEEELNKADSFQKLPNQDAFKGFFPPNVTAIPKLKALRQLAWRPAFLEADKATQQQLLETTDKALDIIQEQMRGIGSSKLSQGLLVDFGLEQAFRAMDASLKNGKTPTPADMQALFNSKGSAMSLLNAVRDNIQWSGCYNRAMQLPAKDRLGFMQACALFQTAKNPHAMNLFMLHKDAITLLNNSGKMTREAIWNALFRNDLPNSVPAGDQIQSIRPNTFFTKLSKDMLQLAMDNPRRKLDPAITVSNAYQMLDAGLNQNIINAYLHGDHLPDSIDMHYMSASAGICTVQDQTDVAEGILQLDKDLPRSFGIAENSENGLVNKIPATYTITLPGLNGLPQQTIAFDPTNPGPELTKQPTTPGQKLADIITNCCGSHRREQITGVLLAMAQGGEAPSGVRLLFGQYVNDNIPVNVTVTADENQNIHVRRTNIEGAFLDCAWDIVVSPDGTMALQDFTMKLADNL